MFMGDLHFTQRSLDLYIYYVTLRVEYTQAAKVKGGDNSSLLPILQLGELYHSLAEIV